MGVETKYYVDMDGKYLGGFSDGNASIPQGAIEVPSAPADARQSYANGVWSAPPPPIIPTITTRQFLIAAAANGLITWEEAKSSEAPAAIQAVFGTLSAAQKNVAEVTWATMTRIERQDSLVPVVAAAFNKTETQIDDFFLQAALL